MRRQLAILAVLALAAPAAASAQPAGTNAPPGNSAIDEYLESVPSSTGNTPTGTVVRAKPRPLAGAAGRALRAQGETGKRLERIVAATAPARALRQAEHAKRGAAGPAPAPAASATGRSPLSSVADAVVTGSGGGSGMGAAFPILLIVLAAGTIVLTLRRRRPHGS